MDNLSLTGSKNLGSYTSVFTVRLSSMGICPTVEGNSVPGRIVCPATANRWCLLSFSCRLNESFCLLERDEWELHVNRADQTEITVVSVGLYQYNYFHGMI